MAMGLSEAATATGVNRSTIYRAWKAGRLSATKTDTGQIEVEPGRAVPRLPAALATGAPDAPHRDAKGDASASADKARRADALERENKLLRETLEDLRKAVALAGRLSLAAPIAAPGPVATPERLRRVIHGGNGGGLVENA
jgi:hypothetical protein